MKLCIVSPCYNEEESLPTYLERMRFVVGQLQQKEWEVGLIVVDDGSSDRSQEILRKAEGVPIRLLQHRCNQGYGAAIRSGMLEALDGCDWLVVVDVDTNYDQRLMLDFLSNENLASFDLVNVSILAPGGLIGFPWYRKLMSKGATWLYRLGYPLKTRGIYTMTCGYRAYRGSSLKQIIPSADSFYATAEIMLRALRKGHRVLEYPATNHPREAGQSKMRFVRNTLGHLRLIVLMRLGLWPVAPTESTASEIVGDDTVDQN